MGIGGSRRVITTKGVLFDLGGTLISVPEPAPVIRSLLAEKGISKTEQEISNAVDLADRSFDEDDYIPPHFWILWNSEVLGELGIHSRREEIARFLDSQWFERVEIEPYPETVEVLARLSKMDLDMGLVTNAVSSDLRYLVDENGLGTYLEFRATADLAGRRKPNARIFLYAARQMGLPPSEIIFVGDDADLDYHPSEKVGMTPVLVNRKGGDALVRNAVDDLRGIEEYL